MNKKEPNIEELEKNQKLIKERASETKDKEFEDLNQQEGSGKSSSEEKSENNETSKREQKEFRDQKQQKEK
ncbi:hypothetical protein [Salegentibacter chungangensis]|uniref:Uncharacterized protein n=1 Tax=Salegentibacter chungangensis TaxID=1335724 RepID=A0ABW3NP72_9FLAO